MHRINVAIPKELHSRLTEFAAGQTPKSPVTEHVQCALEEYLQRQEDVTMDTARNRVESTPALRQYADLLLEYDWSNRDEHLRWVATAGVQEIADWAERIRRDEASQTAD